VEFNGGSFCAPQRLPQ